MFRKTTVALLFAVVIIATINVDQADAGKALRQWLLNLYNRATAFRGMGLLNYAAQPLGPPVYNPVQPVPMAPFCAGCLQPLRNLLQLRPLGWFAPHGRLL